MNLLFLTPQKAQKQRLQLLKSHLQSTILKLVCKTKVIFCPKQLTFFKYCPNPVYRKVLFLRQTHLNPLINKLINVKI